MYIYITPHLRAAVPRCAEGQASTHIHIGLLQECTYPSCNSDTCNGSRPSLRDIYIYIYIYLKAEWRLLTYCSSIYCDVVLSFMPSPSFLLVRGEEGTKEWHYSPIAVERATAQEGIGFRAGNCYISVRSDKDKRAERRSSDRLLQSLYFPCSFCTAHPLCTNNRNARTQPPGE